MSKMDKLLIRILCDFENLGKIYLSFNLRHGHMFEG